MSEVGRGLYPFPAGIRTPRAPPDPQKVLKFAKKGKKLNLSILGIRTHYREVQRPEPYP